MRLSRETYLDAHPTGQHPALFNRLRQFGRRFSHFPGYRALYPVAWRVLSIAEPLGNISLRPTPAVSPQTPRKWMTIVSANLWHDWPRHRNLSKRLDSFARLIESEEADIVLLQEVARTQHIHVDDWLAGRLGMGYVYSRANGHRQGIGFEEGLAVFSRFPLGNPQLRQLGGEAGPFVRRLALGASIETPFGNMLAFSVHLGLMRGQNARQLNHLQKWVAEVAGSQTALIGGDFNADEKSPHIVGTRQFWLDTFRHLNPFADGTTHELRWPWGNIIRRHRLDYIFLRQGEQPWKVAESRLLKNPDIFLSDHRAVLTRLVPAY